MKALTAADLIVTEVRTVDSPMMSAAEIVHQRAKKPGNPRVGKIDVMGNAMTRIGALCYVRKRLSHHEKAAERFKSLYEGLYGSGMPAVDAGRVGVDCSIIGSDGGMAARIDRGAAIALVLYGDNEKPATFERHESDLLISVLVFGTTCSELADDDSWRSRERKVDELLALLDRLSDDWGYGRSVA